MKSIIYDISTNKYLLVEVLLLSVNNNTLFLIQKMQEYYIISPSSFLDKKIFLFSKKIHIKKNVPVVYSGKSYIFLDQIGKGGEAIVYKGLIIPYQTISKLTETATLPVSSVAPVLLPVYAIKKFTKKDKFVQFTKNFQNEVEILKSLQHENIITLYSSSLNPKYNNNKEIIEIDAIMSLEYCPMGDLFAYLGNPNPDLDGNPSESFKRYPLSLIKNLTKQIFTAIKYLHDLRPNCIIHRDIKLQNILITSSENNPINGALTIKITDFGFAKRIEPNERLSDKIGTPNYIAPETLFGNYSLPVDIWAAGVILFIFIYGKPPFQDSSRSGVQDVYNNIKTLKFNIVSKPSLNDIVNDLISKILTFEVDRISLDDILNHPFYN
jgi:serine/threonine protein kinase